MQSFVPVPISRKRPDLEKQDRSKIKLSSELAQTVRARRRTQAGLASHRLFQTLPAAARAHVFLTLILFSLVDAFGTHQEHALARNGILSSALPTFNAFWAWLWMTKPKPLPSFTLKDRSSYSAICRLSVCLSSPNRPSMLWLGRLNLMLESRQRLSRTRQVGRTLIRPQRSVPLVQRWAV
jgi:hypothetical protein